MAVVIVHHEQPEQCVEAIAAFRSQSVPVDITVVDNGSSPAALATLRAGAVGVTILETGANLGYGPGANAGLRAWLASGTGDWVAVAAHDAQPAPGCLEALLAAGDGRPDAALVCAEFGEDYDVVPVADVLIGGHYVPAERGQGWQEVDYPHGTLFVARRAALERIGLFDERYFAYCEEVDLGLRARANGWRIGMVWGAEVRNGRLPTQLLADYLEVRNTLVLVRTHWGRKLAGIRLALTVAPVVRRAVIDRRRWRTHLYLEGRAAVDFLRGRTGPPPPAVLAVVRNAGDGR